MDDMKNLIVTNEIRDNIKATFLYFTLTGKEYHLDGISEGTERNDIISYLSRLNAKPGVYNFSNNEKIWVLIGIKKFEEDILDEDILKENIIKESTNAIKMCRVYGYDNLEIIGTKNLREKIMGIVLGNYKYKNKNSVFKVNINTQSDEIKEFLKIYNTQNYIRYLGETPSNIMDPNFFIEKAKQLLKNSKISLGIYDEKYLEKEGANLILSVGQGSNKESKLLKIIYKGRNSNITDLAIIGKGVVFDSGGICLKSAGLMYKQKGDMMGAAHALGLIYLISSFELKINANVIIPLVENGIGGTATKPGDVFVSLSGTSVEVNNTDAEGRLIIADAITFAEKDNPKYIIDIATLTGSVKNALGSVYTGYFTNDESFNKIITSGFNKGLEPAWRLPLSPFYRKMIDSFVADIKTSGGARGGAPIAAEFIKEFVSKGIIWAHFDIAGVNNTHHNKTTYGAEISGKPISGLYEMIKELSYNIKE